jgi:hypothetical protein
MELACAAALLRPLCRLLYSSEVVLGSFDLSWDAPLFFCAHPHFSILSMFESRGILKVHKLSRLLFESWGPNLPQITFFRVYLVDLIALDWSTLQTSGSVEISRSYGHKITAIMQFSRHVLPYPSCRPWGSDRFYADVYGYGTPFSAHWYTFCFAMFIRSEVISDSKVTLFFGHRYRAVGDLPCQIQRHTSMSKLLKS